MENTFLICPDMLGISELVLTPFMESLVESTFIEHRLCAWVLRPKAESRKLAFGEDIQYTNESLQSKVERSIDKVPISHRRGQEARDLGFKESGDTPRRKDNALGRV